jgi:hypothetical protein
MIIEVLAIELPEYFNMLNFLNCENVGIHHLDDAPGQWPPSLRLFCHLPDVP